jgi:hypothetical protein
VAEALSPEDETLTVAAAKMRFARMQRRLRELALAEGK